jgi:molybdenum cofactor biosynthesis protein B
VIICSTSRFAHKEKGRELDDLSGDLIVQTLTKSGHKVISHVLIPDEPVMIKNSIEEALNQKEVNAVVVSGGTGIAPKDLTIETVVPMFSKTLPGFGELFRKLSYDTIGSAALMSRATAGIMDGKAVFCIPGSINAVALCLNKLILPEAGHIVKHSREKP